FFFVVVWLCLLVFFSFLLLLSISSFLFSDIPFITNILTLSLHDALPISVSVEGSVPTTCAARSGRFVAKSVFPASARFPPQVGQDRKSTRLNSSHVSISYAVFCLKKKMVQLFF